MISYYGNSQANYQGSFDVQQQMQNSASHFFENRLASQTREKFTPGGGFKTKERFLPGTFQSKNRTRTDEDESNSMSTKAYIASLKNLNGQTNRAEKRQAPAGMQKLQFSTMQNFYKSS